MADTTRLVARREIKEGVRTTSYKVTLALSAVVLAVIIVIANLGDDSPDPERVAVAGAGGGEAGSLVELGTAVGVPVEVQQVPDDATARAAVADGDADLAISADGRTLTTKEELDLSGDTSLARLVNVLRADLALRQGLEDAGLSPDEAATVRAAEPPALDTIDTGPTDEVDPGRVTTALVTNVFLFLMLQTYGGWVLTAVTREKASRVVEVLLSIITPRQLLVGKLVGVGIVALIHASVLAAVALVATRAMGADITDGIRLGDLAIFLIWFALGYALYCGAFAAAGSLVSRMEDAQTVAFPIMLPLLFGYIVSFSAVDGANTLVWILAFIPLTSVVAMPTLYALGEASLWAVGVSMVITALGVVAMAMAAARIYERSVLQSRKLSWRQAVRSPREIDEEGPSRPDAPGRQVAAASVDR
jgi:ABC-2 type transport system permease protein